MKRKTKSKKQLDRERELERNKKKAEFEKQYKKEKKEWEESGLASWHQFDSLKTFLEKKLNEWESSQLKVPTGRYQDEERIVSNYQQKFIYYVGQLCPNVIEELREFLPYLERLMGEQKDKYIDIFDTHKMEFFDLETLLDSKINYSIIKDNFLKFRPDKYQNYRYDYQWGEYRLLLLFLYCMFVREESSDKCDEALREIVQLLQNNLVIESDCINLPEDLDESILQNYISNQSRKIIEEILSKDEYKFFREDAETKVTKFLQGISPTPETSVADFIKLQLELLKWAERHNLQKDWLLRYAYFFISQFSNNPNAKLDDIEIVFLDIRSLEGHPFEFQFNGWKAGDEDKEAYEKRVTEKFESELQRYFHIVSNHFDLDKITKITKPLSYDRVKWLVRWTVQGWSKEQILEEIDKEFQKQGVEKYYDIRTIEIAFRQFKEFDLPVKT